MLTYFLNADRARLEVFVMYRWKARSRTESQRHERREKHLPNKMLALNARRKSKARLRQSLVRTFMCILVSYYHRVFIRSMMHAKRLAN